jgi:hypothetical protein
MSQTNEVSTRQFLRLGLPFIAIVGSSLSLPSWRCCCTSAVPHGNLALHVESVGHAIGTVCAAQPLTFRMQAQPIVSGDMVIEAFRSVRFSQTLKYPGVFKCVPRTLRPAGTM